MLSAIRPALILLALLTVVTGAVYPLAVTGIADLLFHDEAHGSLVVATAGPVGSELVGQNFTRPGDFWSRPSAVHYDAKSSGASNMGPLHEGLQEAVAARIATLQAADPEAELPVPADLVLASGSGLDPHISPAAARYQARRVARARGLPTAEVLALIEGHTEGRTLGILGEPRVNVLRLNRALEEIQPSP
ncbi:potassium-transporting ATPase subunit KdpC [Nannocystis sp. ILAH1]|uniref:potassium-transporting ATPase subunit KdpC n=1 Tax=unclassified Nannocystis TaxID=2627009 RepID=UPI00226F988B|nr:MULTISPECIES: potassium-transporting ATPase subunit KdpC [unclassified Nannocystis]MCY0987988.1 potassium-transporting ATPase subunit KdpC [Nannocystis sp. ILAH1]MCY1065669.1 potassium-transporting ATPase subunit KdpC [Nannocystis sp. RBIL2]